MEKYTFNYPEQHWNLQKTLKSKSRNFKQQEPECNISEFKGAKMYFRQTKTRSRERERLNAPD